MSDPRRPAPRGCAEGASRPRPGFPARLPPNAAPSPPVGRGVPRPLGAAPVGREGGDGSGQGAVRARSPRRDSVVPATGVGLDSAAVRAAMVRRLAAQGVGHPAVLQAMGEVPRHAFVDSALVNQAYEDTSLPIGLGQTISKPSVVARMLELLVAGRSLPLGRVLEVGTGCGYQAAVLSRLCSEVYSIERLKALHDKAKANLRPFRLARVHLLLGDGMLGFAAGAPYAGLLVAAAGAAIPAAWVEQLAVGGRIVAPTVTDVSGRQCLVVVEKTPTGVSQTVLETVQFVPLKSGVA